MQERGVFVDHVTVYRGAIKMLPVLAAVFRGDKRPVGRNWRMDDTNMKVSGQSKYLYGAVDREGDTVEFLLTAKRDLAAAHRFLDRAINLHGLPEKIIVDKSGADTAAIRSVSTDTGLDVELTTLTQKTRLFESVKTGMIFHLMEMRSCHEDEQVYGGENCVCK